MAAIKMYGRDGQVTGELEVADEAMVLDRGEQAVRDVVVARAAYLRAGTASTLRKGEVAGSNKKPWRQKGTGRARAGYRQSPIWRGGGVAFGPHPRDYSVKVNKKVSRLAFRRVMSERIVNGSLKIVDALSLAKPKTAELKKILVSLEAPSALIVTLAPDETLLLSARNLTGVEVVTARNCSVYLMLRYPMMVVTRAAWEVLKARLTGECVEEEAAS